MELMLLLSENANVELFRGSMGLQSKNSDLGYDWVCRSIFTVKFENKITQKLRIIILLHGELVTFNFRFPKIPKVFSFMIFGPSAHVHDPKKQLFLTLDTQN